jgi:hypothetical protein
VGPSQLNPWYVGQTQTPPLATDTACGDVCRGQGPPRWFHLRDLEGHHSPRHVHVYRDGKLVLKWNLDAHLPMLGKPTARILSIIVALEKEGPL